MIMLTQTIEHSDSTGSRVEQREHLAADASTPTIGNKQVTTAIWFTQLRLACSPVTTWLS
jgi:hypothetical protein